MLIQTFYNKYNEDPDHLGNDDWQLGTYDQIALRLNDDFKKVKQIHPVDVVSIGTKSDPIPLKDVDDKYLSEIFGRYLGHADLISALEADTFYFRLQDQKLQHQCGLC